MPKAKRQGGRHWLAWGALRLVALSGGGVVACGPQQLVESPQTQAENPTQGAPSTPHRWIVARSPAPAPWLGLRALWDSSPGAAEAHPTEAAVQREHLLAAGQTIHEAEKALLSKAAGDVQAAASEHPHLWVVETSGPREEGLQKLKSLPGVLWVEADGLNQDFSLPPEYTSSPSDISHVSAILRRIRADVVHASLPDTPISRPVVAVIDSGVDYKHPDLASNVFENPWAGQVGWSGDTWGIDSSVDASENQSTVWGGADAPGPGNACTLNNTGNLDSQRCGHGTHVAGLIAAAAGAATDPDLATLGVCPYCRILPIRATSTGRSGSQRFNLPIMDSSIVRGMEYVLKLKDPVTGVSPVKVLNLSIGKFFPSEAIRDMIARLQEADILVVAAAGNLDSDSPSYPAAYPGVVGVCATSNTEGRGDYAKAPYSNFGEWVRICAPGGPVVSTLPGQEVALGGQLKGRTGSMMGTSMAAPLVAGAAALLRSLEPNLTAQQTYTRLLSSADGDSLYGTSANANYQGVYSNGGHFYLLGAGLLDVQNLVTGKRGETGQSIPPSGFRDQVGTGVFCGALPQKGGRSASVWLLLLPLLGAGASIAPHRKGKGTPQR